MAPRANWKGFLRLSLVTCPVALYPATSDTEKVSFNQINRKTGHRIKYAKVDADTGEEVASEDIMKGYKVDTDTYIEVSKEELDDIALESTHTIEIDEFVPKTDIDIRYLIRPYYLVPDGKVGHDAFAVIRETIRSMNKVAIGRVVLTNREHIIALEPLGKGLMGTLLRYPYEVRSEKEYFDDIQDVKVTKDMLDLAKHIVEKKSGSFEPDKFEDHYESALIDLINRKRSGIRTTAKAAPKDRRQRHQSDGRAQAQPRQRTAGSSSRQDQGQEAEEAHRRSTRNAAADQRQARRQGGSEDAGAKKGRQAGARTRSIEEGRVAQQRSRRSAHFWRRHVTHCQRTRPEMPWSTPSMSRYACAAPQLSRCSTRRLRHEAAGRGQQQERWQIAVENLINAAEPAAAG